MSFQVETDNLRRQATIWADSSANVATAAGDCSPGFGQGSKFGVMAGSEGVTAMYDEWTSDMSNALTDAAYSFDYLETALGSVANDYDGTDSTVATDIGVLDRQLQESGYHHD